MPKTRYKVHYIKVTTVPPNYFDAHVDMIDFDKLEDALKYVDNKPFNNIGHQGVVVDFGEPRPDGTFQYDNGKIVYHAQLS